MYELYPHQQRLAEQILNAHKTAPVDSKLLVVSPTGSGKTVVLSYIAQQLKVPTLVVVHRGEVVDQNHETLQHLFDTDPVGILQAGKEETKALVHSCSIQTLSSWSKRGKSLGLPPIELLLVDEAHLNKAQQLQHVLNSGWLSDNCRVIGFTATPCTLTGKTLGDVYDLMIQGSSTAQLQKLGYLPEFKVMTSPRFIDTTGVSKSNGDFNSKALSRKNPPAVQAAVALDAYKHAVDHDAIAPDARGIIFSGSVEASKATEKLFSRQGITIKHIDGTTDVTRRCEAIASLKTGDTQVLSNVGVFCEGFDCPKVSWVMLARPTQSLALYFQQFGRGLRGKDTVVILDPAGNVLRHGLPTDIDTWELDRPTKSIPPRFYEESDGTLQRITQEIELDLKLSGFVEVLSSGEKVTHQKVDPRTIRNADDQLIDRFFDDLVYQTVQEHEPLNLVRVKRQARLLAPDDQVKRAFLLAAFIEARRTSIIAITNALGGRTKREGIHKAFKACGKTKRGVLFADETNQMLRMFGYQPSMLPHLMKQYQPKISVEFAEGLEPHRFDTIKKIANRLMETKNVKEVSQEFLGVPLQQFVRQILECKKTSEIAEKRWSFRR